MCTCFDDRNMLNRVVVINLNNGKSWLEVIEIAYALTFVRQVDVQIYIELSCNV